MSLRFWVGGVKVRVWIWLVILASIPVGAHGQGTVGGGVGILGVSRGVQGAPFSADVIHENTQVLSDGNRIHQESRGKMYRDSQGRTRTEHEWPAMLTTGERVRFITIFDPVAQVSISLNPRDKTARVRHFGVPSLPTSTPLRPPTPERPKTSVKLEQLGEKDIDGFTAKGARTTHTIEAGAVGNEQPIVSTNENWVSTELKTTLEATTRDPRSGERTMRLMNIQRGEPDPSLFQIPRDYRVKDEDPN